MGQLSWVAKDTGNRIRQISILLFSLTSSNQLGDLGNILHCLILQLLGQ